MSEHATPAAAPTAAPSTSSAAPSTGSTPSAPTKSMSTADFKSFLRNSKSQPQVDYSAPETHEDPGAEVDNPLTDPAEEVLDETELPVEESAVDYSWAEPLSAYREGVHGVATAELLQALANGQIPEALFDKLSLTMKDGDDEWTGTVGDLRNSAQMHANYTRKAQALAAERKQYEAERSELVDHLRSWKEDPTKGLLGLERMLGAESVYKIAEQLAQRLQRKEQLEALEAEGKLPPGTAQALMERDQLEREAEELRRAQTRQTEKQTQAQTAEQAKATGQKIWAEGQRQFASLGVKPNEQGQYPSGLVKLFKEELATLWEEGPAPSAAMIRTAAMAAKQRSEEIVRQIQAEQAAANKKPAGQPIVKGAAPAGSPAPAAKTTSGPTGGRVKPMSTAEFKKTYNLR